MDTVVYVDERVQIWLHEWLPEPSLFAHGIRAFFTVLSITRDEHPDKHMNSSSEIVPLDMCAQRIFISACKFALSDQNLHGAHFRYTVCPRPVFFLFFLFFFQTQQQVEKWTCSHFRTSIWCTEHEKGPYTVCGQCRPWSACAWAQADPGLHCPPTELMDSVVYVDEYRMLRSDCTDAHVNLDQRCPQTV